MDLPIIRSREDLPELMKEAPYVFLVKLIIPLVSMLKFVEY
jgi:hypothetical protein